MGLCYNSDMKNGLVHHLDQLPVKEMLPGYYARLMHGSLATLALWEIKKDAVLPEHGHPQEQANYMLEGEFEMFVNGQRHHLKAGDVLIVPSHAMHKGRALTDCKIFDVYAPRREDYVFI